MASPAGLEPATHSLGNCCSILLSYGDREEKIPCRRGLHQRALSDASGDTLGGLGCGLGLYTAAMHLPQKRLHRLKRPKDGAVVALARLVLVQQACDRIDVEQARFAQQRSA
jgi:hypothetical protein